MFRAIGVILILYVVTNIFSAATIAFEDAIVATFNTIELAATVSQATLEANTPQ